MLVDFFKLNAPFTVFHDKDQLTGILANSNDLRNVLFQPSTLTVDTPNASNPFIGKTFTNVSFSKTEISGVIFRNCTFEDCLFIGTKFVNCEFHGCSFTGCNSHRVEFKNTYIDPSVFEGMLNPVEHWNIGMHLFQQLYDNSMEMRQREFANSAEFNRYKWKRYVLNHRHSGWRKKDPRYIMEWLTNYLFYILAGYGIRSKFLAAWALIAVAGSLGVNFLLWDSLDVVGKDGTTGEREFIKVLYYTATIPGGVGDFTPASDIGRLIFLGEAFFGLVIGSLFVTWLVKRALR